MKTGSNASLGGTTYDATTGAIVFDFDGTSNFIHETTHGGQFESQNMAFEIKTGVSILQDLDDEVAAYRAQYAFDPASVSGLKSTSTANNSSEVTQSWVQGISASDGSTPYGPGGSTNTGLVPINMKSTRDDLIRAYPNAGLSVLPVTVTIKDIVPTIYYKK